MSERTPYYDKTRDALLFTGEAATPEFWESHWEKGNIEPRSTGGTARFVLRTTRRYLDKGARILEGGCGKGDKVHMLHTHGYEAYGIDYAKATIQAVNRIAPELKIHEGDVRKTAFPDSFFDGYWSLGVIEHFYDGYEEIQDDMCRVIKTGGYLFVVTPIISHLRSFKIAAAMYPSYHETALTRSKFYQFAFRPENVIGSFVKKGFTPVKMIRRGGLKGLKDEVRLLKPTLQWAWGNPSLPARMLSRAVSLMATWAANHTALFVFRKM